MAGFDNDVLYADNVDFSGGSPVVGKMTTDGQILIGSTVAPNIRVGTLTAGTGISITNGSGTIVITNTGGGGGGGGTESLMGDVGSATEVGGIIKVFGATGITTAGASQTLVIAPANDLAALEALSGTGYAVRTGSETWALRTFIAGTGISLSNADGVAGATTINASSSVPTTFNADAGSATPSSNIIVLAGTSAQGLSTSAAGNTVTFTNADATSVQKGVASFNATNFTVSSGNVTSNAITVTAGTGLTTGGSVNLGGSVTLALDIPVTVPHGGTGQTSFTAHGVILGEGASALGVTAAGTNGQVLIGSTGLDPVFGTISGSNGITITGGAGTLAISNVNIPNAALANSSITITAGAGISVVGSPVSLGGAVTISATGAIPTSFTTDSGTATPSANNINIFGGPGVIVSASGATITINSVTFTDTTAATLVADNGYFATAAGTYTLPANPAQGETVIICCDTTGAVALTAAGSHVIRLGNVVSSAGGSATSTARGDSLTLRYRATGTVWFSVSSVGNWSIV